MAPLVPNQQLMTDASDQGWGGILFPQGIGGPWSPGNVLLFKRGIISINLLEVKAVLLSIRNFLDQLKDQVVQIR